MTPEIETVPIDLPAEDTEQGLSLLDLAEILDQHKIWVESGGESGTKADFCGVNLSLADLTGVNLQGAVLHKANLRGADLSMANLRGASLVQADLRDANLLGTELHGADLMGAMLHGAEGLWVGRLGGTNLFDAVLPESVSAFDGPKVIAQASKIARWFYFLILSLCAACGMLIALTTDVRLLLDASALPIAGIPKILPLSGFFLGAPLLLFFLYVRFHFLLVRLWGNMAALPAVFPDGQTPEKEGPWFLMGPIRRHFRWTRDNRSPFSLIETILSMLLVYWVVPATLFLFWLRYLVRQDARGTLLHVVVATAAVAAATSLPIIISRVLRPGDVRRALSKNVFRLILMTMRTALATGLFLSLLSLGVLRGLPADHTVAPEVSTADIRRWAAQSLQYVGFRPYADITEASLSPATSPGGAPEASVGEQPGARLNQINLRYARAYRATFVNARLWRANLEGAYLSESDLRGANLREAVLRSATLDRVQAGRVNLVSADARGANFAGADLRDADFSYGNLENAILSNAKLNTASLYAVNLKNAQLLRTDLSHADLRDAKLDNSTLSRAVLQETDLSSAKLSGANLTGAQLKGTILLDADLTKADLRGAFLPGAIVRGAQLGGANLEGTDLRGAIGLSAAQLCSAWHWQAAVLDPDVASEVQNRCGTPQPAPTASAHP